jgi:hypothetical protein
LSCCKDGTGPGAWRFIPDDRQLPAFKVIDGGRDASPEEQPGRAPAAKGWPWWAWVVVALVALQLMRSSST